VAGGTRREEIPMKNCSTTSGPGTRGRRRTKTSRPWMPVTDSWIRSDDSRLWCRSEESRFDWSQTDPWMRRIEFS
jgi:hypothetical protein